VDPRLFDSVPQSILSLFQCGTLDGWGDLMFIVSDSTGLDQQPVRDHDVIWLWAFFIFILLGSYLCVQLFVGVITDSFHKSRTEYGSVTLSPEQQEWVKTRKIMMAIHPKAIFVRPTGRLRGICYDIVQSAIFGHFITFCILAQCIILGMPSFGQSTEMQFGQDSANIALVSRMALSFGEKLQSVEPKLIHLLSRSLM